MIAALLVEPTGGQMAGLAASFPAESCVMAVTDRRVVVLASKGASMKSIGVTYERTELTLTDRRSKGFGQRLRITFVDDTSVVLDAHRRQPFDQFAAQVG